jgi:hypothetical protein
MMRAPLTEYVGYLTGANMQLPQNAATLQRWVHAVGEQQVRDRLIQISYPYGTAARFLSERDWHVTAPWKQVFGFAL